MILLAFNKIKDIDAGTFEKYTDRPDGTLDKVTSIFLGDNEITELPDGVFDGLSSLQRLDLRNNPVANYTTRYKSSHTQISP